MSVEANKAVVRAYVDLYRSGDLNIADRIIAPDFVDHAQPNGVPGPKGVKRVVTAVHAAFSDLTASVERMVAEGDMVAFQFVLTGTHLGVFAGIAPIGERVTISGMDFVHVHDGHLTDIWSVQDAAARLARPARRRALGYASGRSLSTE